MSTLTLNHTTLKREAAAYTSYGILDDVRLLLHADNTIRVLVERREPNGTISAAYVYEGTDLDVANKIYQRMLGKAL